MTDTITAPTATAGIAALPQTCWELVYRNTGQHVEVGDGTPHFDSEDEAKSEAALIEEDGDGEYGPIQARQLDGPCYLVTASCGYQLDADVMVMHHPIREDAEAAAKDCGWTIRTDGSVYCDDTCCAEGRGTSADNGNNR